MATTSRFTIHSLAALSLMLGATACNGLEKINEGNGPSGGGIPEDVQRAFDETCATPACHDSATASAGLDLSAAAAPSIIGGMSSSPLPMVDPGNVNGSYLAVKMLETLPEGTTRTGARMPIGGDFDNVNNLIILGWIATANANAGGEGGATTTDEPTDGGEEMTEGEDIVACGLDDVAAPGTANPFDIGTAAGQIPPDVGDALTNNCGCHGLEPSDLINDAPPYTTGRVPFNNIDEIRADYDGEAGYDILLGRVDAGTMPPTYYCDLGGGEVISAADMQLLSDWLSAEAPDAPEWEAMQ